jgi:hypothetical protein
MNYAYRGCISLTTAVCGPNVTTMNYAYRGCISLTTAVCGDNVTTMYGAYDNCTNLTTAVCGPNVTGMGGAYRYCYNLTTAVCGPNVTDMSDAYRYCTNLTTAVCGPNVTDMTRTYISCTNISGNFYVYSNSVWTFDTTFYNRNTSNVLNIYVHAGTRSNTYLTYYTNSHSIVGKPITWTASGVNRYNTAYNIYIYPVANVEATRIANGD